jgi:hypothetical protein
VVYKGGEGSSTEEEIEEQGWTEPDYYFVAGYGGVESMQSKPLDVKGWVKIIAKHKDTGEIQANKKYTVILSDNTTCKGVTDDEGAIYLNRQPIGDIWLRVEGGE